MRRPRARPARDQVEAHHGHGQAVNHTLRVFGQIEAPQHDLADQIDGGREGAAAAVEAAALGHAREECAHLAFAPPGQEFGFFVDAATFGNEGHGQQFTIATIRRRAGTVEQGRNRLPGIVHQTIDPQAKVRQIRYHGGGPPRYRGEYRYCHYTRRATLLLVILHIALVAT